MKLKREYVEEWSIIEIIDGTTSKLGLSKIKWITMGRIMR
jgi:hypothetical protein